MAPERKLVKKSVSWGPLCKSKSHTNTGRTVIKPVVSRHYMHVLTCSLPLGDKKGQTCVSTTLPSLPGPSKPTLEVQASTTAQPQTLCKTVFLQVFLHSCPSLSTCTHCSDGQVKDLVKKIVIYKSPQHSKCGL